MIINVKKIARKTLKNIVLLIYHLIYKLSKVKDNLIIFESSLGRNYSGNPKYVYEYMVSKGLDQKYKCVWIIENKKEPIPGECIKIKRLSLKYFYYLSKAKVWVFDTRQPVFVKKKPEVIFIQTWHGTPLKRLANDMQFIRMYGEYDINSYKKNFITTVQLWDYLISQNKYSSHIFKQAFQFNKDILEIGYPRNDILMKMNNDHIIHEIKKNLNLPKEKKVILYAPTWRDNQFDTRGKYRFEIPFDLRVLKEKLENNYIIIIKLHYMIKDHLKEVADYKGFVYDVSTFADTQKLMLISDVLITDYSSVMFDFSLLKRPIVFYTYDLAEYRDEIRGFYFNLEEEAPGPIVTCTNDLVNVIQNIDQIYNLYRRKYEIFVRKFNEFDKGNASEKLVNLIQKYLRS